MLNASSLDVLWTLRFERVPRKRERARRFHGREQYFFDVPPNPDVVLISRHLAPIDLFIAASARALALHRLHGFAHELHLKVSFVVTFFAASHAL